MDLENFPTRESAKDMLSMVSPIYDRSYVGKWIFQVMAAPMELARETVEDIKTGVSGNSNLVASLVGRTLRNKRKRGQKPGRTAAPDCAETKHKTPYEPVPYCSPGGRNFRAGG